MERFVLGLIFIFSAASFRTGRFCKPLTPETNATTKMPPFVEFSFPVEFMDSAEYAEFMKGANDPIFNATTKPGWFTGMRYKWNVTVGTESYPSDYEEPTSEEPIMRVTVQLPPKAKIQAYMRGHAHLIDDEFAYEELYNWTHFSMYPL